MKNPEYNKFENNRVYCSGCNHSIRFLRRYPVVCSFCGTLVYPSKREEFKEKLKKEMRKNEYFCRDRKYN